MSTVYLIPDKPGLDVIAFHVTTIESHTSDATLTENPVEDGSIFTDHVIQSPLIFSFEAEITESPGAADFYGNGEDLEASIDVPTIIFPFPRVLGASTYKIKTFGRSDWRDRSLVSEMADRLEALKVGAVPLTILTSLKEYESMVVVHWELPRQPLSLGKGAFKVDTKQLSIVSTATVTAPKPKEPRGAKIKATGAQSKADTDAATKGALKSWAAGLLDGDANLGKMFTGG